MKNIMSRHQSGISLIMVLLVLVLVALTAISASRSSLFNETVTGNEADYNRALSAAEALVRDAQIDILGKFGPLTSQVCNPNPNAIGCRISPTGVATLTDPFFPAINSVATAKTDHGALVLALNNVCSKGICAPAVWPTNALADQFWLDTAQLTANIVNAATYGQYTGAVPALTGNPILMGPGAWYWVEIIPGFDGYAACTGAACPSTGTFVYRITAVARGNRLNTLAAIQTFFVPHP